MDATDSPMTEGGNRATLSFFGKPSFVDEAGQPIRWPQMGFMLALYLLLGTRQGQAARSEVADFLWPNSPTALTNLRQLLARLRSAQETQGPIASTGDRVRIDLSDVDCDLTRFQSLARRPDLVSAKALLDIYGTGLFDERRLRGTDSPEGWMAAQAERLRGEAVTSVADLLEGCDVSSEPDTVIHIARRLTEIDPHCETGWRRLMECHAAREQRAGMAQAFDQYRDVMRHDLGEPPSPRMRGLYDRLLVEKSSPSVAAQPTVPSALLRPMDEVVSLPRLAALPPRGATPACGQMGTIADLLIEDVTIRLCSLRSIDVVAPHTAWRLGGEGIDRQVIENFRLDYMLDTRVIELAGRVKLALKLFNARDRTILWADLLDLSEATGEDCYQRISAGTTSSLASAVDLAEQARYATDRNPTAYYWYLLGQHHLKDLDLPNVRRSRKCFEQALRTDAAFAPAHSGRARSLHREWLLLGRGETALLDAAENAGRQATDFDPADSRGYREVALSSLYLCRFDESLDYYEKAERLSPNHADIVADHADALAHSGRPEEGLRKMRTALQLNPIPPDQYWWDLAGMHFQLNQYEDAIHNLERMQRPIARFRLMAACWALLGDEGRARSLAGRFLETYPDFRVDHWLSLVPNRNPQDRKHYERGLRAAGFQ